MKSIDKGSENQLVDKIKVRVRFSEVDSMRVVWHGEYLRYFEDGRESFGRNYGISYSDLSNAGFQLPVVKMECEYKSSLTIDDVAVIETRFVNCESAKIIFEYAVYKESDMRLCARGRSVQVFLDTKGDLILSNPDFFIDWKRKWRIAE